MAGIEHRIKVWPGVFDAIAGGRKTCEYRNLAGRAFEVGDFVVGMEYDPETRDYTGHEYRRRISWIDVGPDFGIRDGYCVLSLAPEEPNDA